MTIPRYERIGNLALAVFVLILCLGFCAWLLFMPFPAVLYYP